MEVIMPWLICFFVLLCLCAIFFAAWRKTGVWFNPSSLFALAWVVYLAVPLLIGFGVVFNPVAVLYILLFILCFSLSTFSLRWTVAVGGNKPKGSVDKLFPQKPLIYFFLFLLALAIVFHILDFKAQGFALGLDAFSNAGEYASRRYSGELNANIFQKLALLASFQVVVFGGFVFGGVSRKVGKVTVMLLAFVPSILVMLLQSGKGLLFLSAAYFIGAWLITRVLANDFRLPQIPFVPAFLSFSVLSVLVVASFIARFGFDIDILRYYLASYSSGHFFAFSDWFSDRYFGYSIFRGYDQAELQLGFYTFMGFFQALGDSRFVPLGIFDEAYIVDGVLTTNIYTVFRGLIMDFGILGSLVLALYLGAIANLSFYCLLNGRLLIISIVTFIYMVGAIYQSYLISPFTWISIPASAVVSGFLILLFKLSSRRTITAGRNNYFIG